MLKVRRTYTKLAKADGQRTVTPSTSPQLVNI